PGAPLRPPATARHRADPEPCGDMWSSTSRMPGRTAGRQRARGRYTRLPRLSRLARGAMTGPGLPADPSEITVLLDRLSEGDRSVADELARLVYAELHRIADLAMRRERPDHTLQPTLLVNDAFLKLVGQ